MHVAKFAPSIVCWSNLTHTDRPTAVAARQNYTDHKRTSDQRSQLRSSAAFYRLDSSIIERLRVGS